VIREEGKSSDEGTRRHSDDEGRKRPVVAKMLSDI
jgi:hypothetical protein